MNIALLSMFPAYASGIIQGIKTLEFRRKLWSRHDISFIFIYSSSPVKGVVGAILDWSVHDLHIEDINLDILDRGFVTYEELINYFAKGKPKTTIKMIEIKVFDVWEEPRPLSQYGISHPPMNYMFMDTSKWVGQ